MSKKKSYQDLPLDKLFVDTTVQRTVRNPRRVARIAAELDLDSLGTICVSHRSDGTYHVIDGQHRLEALKMAGRADFLIHAEVWEGLTLPDEAAMFRLRNNTTQVQFIDRFRVRIIEGESVATDVINLMKKYGWSMPGEGHGDEIVGLQALESLFDTNSEVADATLYTVTKAWGYNQYGVDNRMIRGLGLFLRRYADLVDITNLIERLALYGGGPGTLIGHARGLRDVRNGTVPNAVAELITDEYNKNKRSKRLPVWNS